MEEREDVDCGNGSKSKEAFFLEGKMIKEITRNLGLSRNTVRKIIRSVPGATEHSYSRENQVFPKLGPYLER
jgi:hypothetical protein